jgi:hypothetical protein
MIQTDLKPKQSTFETSTSANFALRTSLPGSNKIEERSILVDSLVILVSL